jgi:hypothetical protein
VISNDRGNGWRGPALARLWVDGWHTWVHHRTLLIKLTDGAAVELSEGVEFTPPSWLLDTDFTFLPLSAKAKDDPRPTVAQDGLGGQLPVLTSTEAASLIEPALLTMIGWAVNAHPPDELNERLETLVRGSVQRAFTAWRSIAEWMADVGGKADDGSSQAFESIAEMLVGNELLFVAVEPERRQLRKLTTMAEFEQRCSQWRRMRESLGLEDAKFYVSTANARLAAEVELLVQVPDGVCLDAFSAPDRREVGAGR